MSGNDQNLSIFYEYIHSSDYFGFDSEKRKRIPLIKVMRVFLVVVEIEVCGFLYVSSNLFYFLSNVDRNLLISKRLNTSIQFLLQMTWPSLMS